MAVMRGREENVPMQPRRCFSPSLCNVFHVTNSGDSLISSSTSFVLSKGVDVPGVVCAVVFDNDDVEDVESGVEECDEEVSCERRVFFGDVVVKGLDEVEEEERYVVYSE
jgi:hypothetical protein